MLHPSHRPLLLLILLLLHPLQSTSLLHVSPRPPPAAARKRPVALFSSNANADAGEDAGSAPPTLVWLTGRGDLRLSDHGGFRHAAACGGPTVPVYVLEDGPQAVEQPRSRAARTLAALRGLREELEGSHGVPLVVRRGSAAEELTALAASIGASSCAVVADDPEDGGGMRGGIEALEAAGVRVVRWGAGLRRAAPWEDRPELLPDTWEAYSDACAGLPADGPEDAPSPGGLVPFPGEIRSEGVPEDAPLTHPEWNGEREDPTDAPYQNFTLSMSTEQFATEALRRYAADGRDAFASAFLSDAGSAPSLHAAAARRLLAGAPGQPSRVLAQREAPFRAFAPALTVGSVSARMVRATAEGAGHSSARPDDKGGFLGQRDGPGALADAAEWSEYFRLLALRSLALQEKGEDPTAARGRQAGGDLREAPDRVGYWRWGGQHLVRHLKWEGGEGRDPDAPALVLVHGFAASAEQWERMVRALREDAGDACPAIYALDLLGFGHSEKPGLSYTQYLWEAQIIDFVREVVRGPVVVAGNSIGGGLSAGAAPCLGRLCRGVVLVNTAGVLVEPDEYVSPRPKETVGALAKVGRDDKGYSPPLPGTAGMVALDLFGDAIIKTIYPQIRKRLKDIYSDRPSNADDALAFAIEQGASFPGSANVIGCGQKLGPNRSLNEVLGPEHGFGGPVLVAQGVNDRVSGPARAQERADTFERLRDGVTVVRINGGHCVQDDSPEEVARALWRWWPAAATHGSPSPEGTTVVTK